MANIKTIIILSVVSLAFGDKMFPGPIKTSPQLTNSSTAVPTTTPALPTSSSPPNTTTSAKPTTTTPPKTTTKSTTTATTTTTKPNTTTPTTTPKPTTTATTTVKPTTPAPLQPGRWAANYTNTNRTCVVLEAALQIDVPYKEGNASKTYTVNVPPAASATGLCDNDKVENLTLLFGGVNTVTFNFFKSNDSKKFDVDSVLVTLNVSLPGKQGPLVLLHNAKEFQTPTGNSYKCIKERSLNLTSLDKTDVGELHVSHFQVQAFRNATNTKFDEALDCESAETPDVVPIAVGCALAALVIIVLIAYLIGRRRSQARGYLSM